MVPQQFFDNHFSDILHSQINLLDSPLRCEAHRKLAIGLVAHSEVNAYILKNEPHECYAIVVNGALITLLNHYVKLVQASRHIDAIVYCSDVVRRQSDFPPLMSKMLSDYLNTGLPYGPELKLEPDSVAMQMIEVTLLFIHRFIIAHELAHFINGDLAGQLHFAPPSWNKNESVFGRNVSHEMEFKADIVGFGILIRMVAGEAPGFPANRLFEMSVKILFNFFRGLDESGCSTHPPSSARMLVIAHHFFGEDATRALSSSFDDLSFLEVFGKLTSGITVTDLL